MLKHNMQIIPAIDIIDGKCVRLTQGDYAHKTVYHENPLTVAKEFEKAGLTRLHLVDLDGARTGTVKNWEVLRSISANTSLVIDFGGGMKTEEDIQTAFASGAALVTIGSLAARNERLFVSWIEKYGADKFLLGADVRDEKITVAGWLETTGIHVHDFIAAYMSYGIRQVFCTDVSKDGKMQGPAVELYSGIIRQFPSLQLIASGGISSTDDLKSLQRIGCYAAIVGKAIYENAIPVADLVNLNYAD